MMPSYGVGLAALDQPLQCKQPRRLQHPVARDDVTFGNDKRFLDQCTEMLQDVPTVDSLFIFCDLLGGLEREASGEDTQATQDDLLGGCQQLVAPLERRSQRLVTAQRSPPTPGKNVEALIELVAQAFDTQQRHARSCEFDSQRYPIETPADISNHRLVLGAKFEAAICCLGTRHEQRTAPLAAIRSGSSPAGNESGSGRNTCSSSIRTAPGW